MAATACSPPAPDAATEAADAPAARSDLALTAPVGETPVASAMEVHRAEPAARAQPHVPTPEPEAVPEPRPEPLGIEAHGDHGVALEPVAVATSHVHPKAAEPDEATAPAPGGGKPNTGVTEGRGPVPDRGWGGADGGIMDDPNPLPGITGRGGPVIIRGGVGGVDDDCAIHRPRGGVATTGRGVGAGTLVNDRGPRGGTLINERAPRTSGGGAFPRGGGMVRGGIR